MMSPDFPPNDSPLETRTSRRALLAVLAVAPAATLAAPVAAPWEQALTLLHDRYDDEPAALVRTKESRSLSRFRYHNAETFFESLDRGFFDRRDEMLYQSGIVVQLALTSHLLDIGFSDRWNATNIRLDVAKGLAYANATGFAHSCLGMARLAAVLSPYWKWGHAHHYDQPRPDDGGFTIDEVRPLLRALLDRVHDVTGHPRPSGWRSSPQEARP
ncbi:MAG: hypothetical protein ACT6Q5_00415 [Sphingopyxis solisilvae]|uniref:hypothetical protein n=1 Tax=Sphingopyxis solisilvae TaxID=1886788 RepID=UPI004036F24B